MMDEKRGETFVMKGEAETSDASTAPIDFNSLLLGLASTALIHLGETAHPETRKTEKNIVLARQSMDLLGVLRDKTRGNLTPEEEKFFDSLLADLRLRFVEASKK
jgi:hypothetical protein